MDSGTYRQWVPNISSKDKTSKRHLIKQSWHRIQHQDMSKYLTRYNIEPQKIESDI